MTITSLLTELDAAVAALRARSTNEVLLPGDEGYDNHRRGFNVRFDQHPLAVVVPGTTADVAAAVRFARTLGVRVAIKGAGHGMAREADGAVLIATARLTELSVDPEARTARVGAGLRWGAVLERAQQRGLAPLLGSSPGVGAIGYTLGGGMGWLARHYGLASDSVRSFDLVTPDGIEVHTSEEEQPALFWALKGGGAGNLGVVTAMEIELYPVSTVYGGNLFYPVEMAGEVLRRWREWTRGITEDLTSAVTIMNFPPFEEVPEPFRGRSFVLVRGVYSGPDLQVGQALIDDWRRWRQPVLDLFGPMPFTEVASVSMDPTDPLPAMVTTEWFDELDDRVIDIVVGAATAPAGPPPVVFAEIRHAGGAMARKAVGAVNERGRSGRYLLEMVGAAPEPPAALALEAHLRETRLALAPHVTGATYLNFTEGREKQERSASAFGPEQLGRLEQVKGAVDPADRFCHGISVRPA